MVFVFFDVGVAFAHDGAFVFAARDGFVVLDEVGVGRGGVAVHFIRVNVDAAVDPGATPRTIVDDHDVAAPDEVAAAPTPRAEVGTDGDTEAEADGAADEETGTRRRVDDDGIVSGHNDKRRVI